jgi:hypothetical protein
MNKFKKVLVLLLIAAVVSLWAVGCKSKSEHPSGEHPTNEQPTGEHPAGEHPSSEHPTSEHPE